MGDVQKFLADHLLAVMFLCSVGGFILRHYIKRDYALLSGAIQAPQCLLYREDLEKKVADKCDACKERLGSRLEEGDSCFSGLHRDVATLRKTSNLQLWILSQMCQAINSVPGVKTPVDCKKIEAAAEKLLE